MDKEKMSLCSGSDVAGMWGCNTYGNTPEEIAKKNACTVACCKCTDPPQSSSSTTQPAEQSLCVVCGKNFSCDRLGTLMSINECLASNCGTECENTFPDPMATTQPPVVKENFVVFSPYPWGWPVFQRNPFTSQ